MTGNSEIYRREWPENQVWCTLCWFSFFFYMVNRLSLQFLYDHPGLPRSLFSTLLNFPMSGGREMFAELGKHDRDVVLIWGTAGAGVFLPVLTNACLPYVLTCLPLCRYHVPVFQFLGVVAFITQGHSCHVQ
jgi:hypothetical protein